ARLGAAEERERNFLMTVSHELRTPLTAIRGHVDAMREGLTDDPEAEAASLEVVGAAAARLERLVGDVLDLAKLDAHRFTLLREEVDMGRLLDQAYAAFGEEARRRSIDYHCDIDTRPVILTDGDRVLQIISNLLSNAFRWTPRAAFAALRPRQWTKNALVFAGIVFAARTGDAGKWLEAVAAFVTYCAASSAAYLLNDLRDVELDRLHPSKRLRPIARGEL